MAYSRPGPLIARRTNGRTSNLSDATISWPTLRKILKDSDDGLNPNLPTKFRTFLETRCHFRTCHDFKLLCNFLHILSRATIGWVSPRESCPETPSTSKIQKIASSFDQPHTPTVRLIAASVG